MRLAGETICCLGSVVICCKNTLLCCARRCKGEPDPEPNEATSAAAADRPAPRKDIGQLMSLMLMIISILLALIWEFYFATDMDKNAGTQAAW